MEMVESISFEKYYTKVSEHFNPDKPFESIELIRGLFSNEPEYDLYKIEKMLLGLEAKQPFSVPLGRNKWYRSRKTDEYWPSYLSLVKKKNESWGNKDSKLLQTLNVTTSRIVNHLFNPSIQAPNCKYGLVIGHVQSGKTANYCGVITKAADNGYNLIIVLTGLYNDLRLQTQIRLEKEIIGTYKDRNGFSIDSSNFSKPWRLLTKSEPDGDFHASIDPLEKTIQGAPHIAIIKKNITPLEAINKWISNCPESIRSQINLLVIDDEADHASVNTMSGDKGKLNKTTNNSESIINGEIRTLLSNFNRYCYVGYTATPFANVFINPNDDGLDLGPTLYPRDFIVSLPKPDGYYGLEEVFNLSNISPLRIVPDKEAESLRKLTDNENAPITKDLPLSLINALMDYYLTTAAMKSKGHYSSHNTMLIHTKHTKRTMRPLRDRINLVIEGWDTHFLKTRTEKGREVRKDFKNRWLEEFKNISLSWSKIEEELDTMFSPTNKILTFEINSDSDDVLNYQSNDQIGLNAIVIGGNRLSRGLTLEGLLISYFVREAKDTMYDTLLQMGRWFGFKGNNVNLIRIYMTSRLNEQFSSMIQVENALRADLEIYEQQNNFTPEDFGVRVLKVNDLLPTSKEKRRDVGFVSKEQNFNMSLHYTRYVPLNSPKLLKQNLQFFADFIKSIGKPDKINDRGNRFQWKVKSTEVFTLLNNVSYPNSAGYRFDKSQFIEYAKRRNKINSNEFAKWNVALIGLKKSKHNLLQKPLEIYGSNIELVLPERSRKAGNMSIGYIPGSFDLAIDLSGTNDDYKNEEGKFSLAKMWKKRNETQPLLLAYIFDKNSKADSGKGRTGRDDNTNLFLDGEEKVDVLGLMVVLPDTNISEEEKEKEKMYWKRKSGAVYPGLE